MHFTTEFLGPGAKLAKTHCKGRQVKLDSKIPAAPLRLRPEYSGVKKFEG